MGTAHDDATDAEIRANQDDDDERDQDDDPDISAPLPTLYIDGMSIADARDHNGDGADLYDIDRVQLEFDDVASGLLTEAQERAPLAWCNSATIHLDRKEDSVTVLISVGDPRGAFAFTVRRIPTDDPTNPNAGLLVMHTPSPGESMPHETLFEMRPGTYAIGRAWKDRSE